MNARLLLRLLTVGLTAALAAPVAQAQVPSGRLRRPSTQSSALPSGATRPSRANRITAADLERNTQLYWRFDITSSGNRVRTEITRWRGLIEAEDPRRSGPPRRVDYPLGERGDWVMAFYVDRENQVLSQPILDRWGRLVGVVGAHPSGVYVSIDVDRNGSADIFNTHRVTGAGEPQLSDVQTLFATDEGLAHLRNHLANGRALACGRTMQELEAAAASSPEVFGATAASLGPCSGSGGTSASRGGGSRFGNVRSLANRRMTETTWNRLCARYGSGASVGGGRRAAGGNGKDPREFHWGDALAELGRSLNPIPMDTDAMQTSGGESAGMDALETVLGFGVGWAVNATKAVKAFIEGGRGDFVNEADREIYWVERQGGRPNPDKLEEACSAGSTSSFCGEACASGGTQSWCTSGGETEVEPDDADGDAEAPEPPPDTESDGGGGEGDGAGQPVENDPTDISATCEARRQAQWRRRSFTNDTRYLREECSDPREQSAPSTMSAGGVQLSTFCGPAPEPTAPNLSQVVGARGCPPTARPGPGGRCSLTAGTPRTQGGRLSYGALDAVGLEMRLRPCPDATCNPGR